MIFSPLIAGSEIKGDLVELLQKRLDEAALDKICEMLRRNPQCQLERDDVLVRAGFSLSRLFTSLMDPLMLWW